jgi:hypothetical protein
MPCARKKPGLKPPEPETGQAVVMLDVLAFVIMLPFHRSQPRTNASAMAELVTGFESRGVRVVTDHPRCNEATLEGLYVRGSREVVVCRRGDQSSTLRHEGWHLVQTLCLGNTPWLTTDEIERGLTGQDRKELVAFVSRENWPREAEARVMAQRKPKPFFEAVDRACSTRLQPGI